jgi:SPP1 gp7 family putative phage head morphogenesis protein
MQGIIQGESVDQITDRLVTSLCTMNENKMRTFARTSVTSAQNAGRIEQMHDAEDMGIKVKKRWLATLDDRTRDTHQELDGEEEPVDEPFEVDGMKIMFPGDPNAEPCLVYNCRCTLIQVYEGIERKSVRRDDEGNLVENMTYQEWKEWKEGEKGFTGTESPDNIDNENGSVNNTERIAQDKDELGSDEDKLRSMMNYSSLDEESVTDAAEALFGFVSDPHHCYFDGADSEIRSRATPEASKRADAIQKYIDASPKAEGTIYRGMAIPQEMLDSLQPGTEFNENQYAISSWSTSENVGQRYASNSKNKYGGERVVFEYSNPMHGTPIAHLSPVPIEQEVLVNNKEVKYRIVSREEYTKSSSTNGERKFTKIILEEIED